MFQPSQRWCHFGWALLSGQVVDQQLHVASGTSDPAKNTKAIGKIAKNGGSTGGNLGFHGIYLNLIEFD